MSTLISFLGKSASNAQTGYRTANYVFEPGFERNVPFFGMALLEYLKPEKLILAGTAGSMWDVFFDHQHTDDDGLLALMEAVPQQAASKPRADDRDLLGTRQAPLARARASCWMSHTAFATCPCWP